MVSTVGIKIRLPGVHITDLTAPIIPDVDLILPQDGALLFLDPTHSYQQWTDAAPAQGQLYPNLAYAQALDLVPAGNTTTLGAKLVLGSNFDNDGVQSLIERTTKGGLHILFSQTVSGDVNTEAYVEAGSALKTYVLANKAHSFYAAFWGKITRPSIAFTSGLPFHSRTDTQLGLALFYSQPGTVGESEYPVGGTRVGHYQEGAVPEISDDNLFQDIAVSTATAMTAAILQAFSMSQFAGGSPNALRMKSMIFYGYYLEDLTVSGRAYADVHELVYAKYQRDVTTTGGRYFGDTYTDPDTVP